MQRVVHQALVLKKIFPKQIAHPAHVGDGSGEEVPGSRVGFPRGRVLGQSFGLVVYGIKGDGEQNQVAAETIFESFLQNTEGVRTAITKIRQRTTGVDKVEND